MTKSKKRNRSKKSTPSPKVVKVARRLSMDHESMDEPTSLLGSTEMDSMHTSSDDISEKRLLQEMSQNLKYLTQKVDAIDKKQDRILARVDKIERLANSHEQAIQEINSDLDMLRSSVSDIKSKMEEQFSPEVTLVVVNPPSDISRDKLWATKLVQALGGHQQMIVNTLRTPRRNGKNGVLKIELTSVDDKVHLLRNKPRLRKTPGFERVYVRSSKSHLERLMDINFRTVLSEIPQGKSYRITGNGRIVKSEDIAPPARHSSSNSLTSQQATVAKAAESVWSNTQQTGAVPRNSPKNQNQSNILNHQQVHTTRVESQESNRQAGPAVRRSPELCKSINTQPVFNTTPHIQHQQPTHIYGSAYQYDAQNQHLQGMMQNSGVTSAGTTPGQSYSQPMLGYLSTYPEATNGQSELNCQNIQSQASFLNGRSVIGT